MESRLDWDGRELFRLRSASSQVEVYMAEGAGSGWSYFSDEIDPLDRGETLFPMPTFQKAAIDEEAVYGAEIPYWLVLPAAGVFWSGLLMMRRRYVARKLPKG